jgi:hypothetical protein
VACVLLKAGAVAASEAVFELEVLGELGGQDKQL